jgi:hypothetical protein
MKHLRLVMAIAVTFAIASLGVAWGAAGDPLILGQVNSSAEDTRLAGNLSVDRLKAEVGITATTISLEAPLSYHGGSDSTGTVSVRDTGRTTFEWLESATQEEEVFIFLEPIQASGGPAAARYSTSGRFLRSSNSFAVRVSPKPPPGGGVTLAYHIVVWGEP